jgi:hypothetical protein
MAKRKVQKRKVVVARTLQGKLKIAQHDPPPRNGVNSGSLEW